MNEAPCAMVLIPFGNEFIALSPKQLQEARARGRELAGKPASDKSVPLPDEVLTAEQMFERTHIPASWWMEAARQGRIPHLQAGKYVRFKLNETLAALNVTCETVTPMRRKSA